jgi:hypothetical protein
VRTRSRDDFFATRDRVPADRFMAVASLGVFVVTPCWSLMADTSTVSSTQPTMAARHEDPARRTWRFETTETVERETYSLLQHLSGELIFELATLLEPAGITPEQHHGLHARQFGPLGERGLEKLRRLFRRAAEVGPVIAPPLPS